MRLQIKNRRSRLSSKEQSEFSGLLGGWADSPQIVEMKKFIQHGSVDTYAHCKKVAETSFWLSRRLHMKVDEKSLVRELCCMISICMTGMTGNRREKDIALHTRWLLWPMQTESFH